jgi:AcrR family transcriptional regulator
MARRKQLEWVRAPLQARSRDTLDRILDATEHLLEKKTFEEISVAEIARKAKSSVGSFYARFPDKDSLLLELQKRLFAESLLTAEQALAPESWEDVPLSEIIPVAVAFMCSAYGERLGLRRALLARMVSDARFRRPATELASKVCVLLVELFSTRSGEIGHPDLPVAIDMCHRIVFGTLDQAATFDDASPTGRRLATEVMGRELSAACVAYLGVRGPRSKR